MNPAKTVDVIDFLINDFCGHVYSSVVVENRRSLILLQFDVSLYKTASTNPFVTIRTPSVATIHEVL
jgi:hypothetical protein